LLARAFRGGDRIEFDRPARRVRFEKSRKSGSFRVPFEAVDCVEIRREQRRTTRCHSGRDEEYEVFLLFLVLAGGHEFKITELTDEESLRELGRKGARLADAPVSDATEGPRRKPAPAPPGATLTETEARAEGPPGGMRHVSQAGAQVYSWPVLPPKPGLYAIFLLLFVFSVLPAPILVYAIIAEGDYHPENLGAAFCLAILAYKAGPWLTVVVLGRCSLRIDAHSLDYGLRVLGRRIVSESRRLETSHVAAVRVNAGKPQEGGIRIETKRGTSFLLKVPTGAGAYSASDLAWMQKRWQADLDAAAPRPSGLPE